jgi:hypothetical protein
MAIPSYEEQQAALRAQNDALVEPEEEGAEEGVVRPSFRAPEVDPAVYRDTENLLFRGFLTITADINDTRFVFKSLNHHEFNLLEFVAGSGSRPQPSSRFWNTFIAYCVFMIDGMNVLADRGRYIPEVAKAFSEFPPQMRTRIIRHLSEINRRASNAVRLAEAYAMEDQSRFRWAQIRGLDLTQTALTGIPGTEYLGMNWGQLIWRAINYYEDKKEDYDRSWEHAKFVGSCMAGKGISKVYRQDEARRRKDRDARLARKDALLNHVLLGQPMKEQRSKYGVPMVVAHTEEELAEQLERDLKGEKDWHDVIVDRYEQQIRQRREEERQESERIAAQYVAKYGDAPLTGGSDLTGLTPDQLRDRIERKRTVEAQNAARIMVHPQMFDEKGQQHREKWYGDALPPLPEHTPVIPAGGQRPAPTGPFNRRK